MFFNLLDFDSDSLDVIVHDYLKSKYINIRLNFWSFNECIEQWPLLFEYFVQFNLDSIVCIFLQPEPLIKEHSKVILDRVRHAIMVLVIVEALVANVHAALKAVVLGYHFTVTMSWLVMKAQIMHLLIFLSRRDSRSICFELPSLVCFFVLDATIYLIIIEL